MSITERAAAEAVDQGCGAEVRPSMTTNKLINRRKKTMYQGGREGDEGLCIAYICSRSVRSSVLSTFDNISLQDAAEQKSCQRHLQISQGIHFHKELSLDEGQPITPIGILRVVGHRHDCVISMRIIITSSAAYLCCSRLQPLHLACEILQVERFHMLWLTAIGPQLQAFLSTPPPHTTTCTSIVILAWRLTVSDRSTVARW